MSQKGHVQSNDKSVYIKCNQIIMLSICSLSSYSLLVICAAYLPPLLHSNDVTSTSWSFTSTETRLFVHHFVQAKALKFPFEGPVISPHKGTMMRKRFQVMMLSWNVDNEISQSQAVFSYEDLYFSEDKQTVAGDKAVLWYVWRFRLFSGGVVISAGNRIPRSI